jgi:outer membrane protein TolC
MKSLLLPAFFLLLFSAKAQTLTLDEAIRTAQANSPVAKQIRSGYAADTWRYRANKAFLQPQLVLSGTVPGYAREIGGITQPDGTILFQNYSRAFSNLNLGLEQVILATGGRVSLNTGLDRIDIFGQNRTSYWAAVPLALRYTQPLFRINQVKWTWQQQQLRYQLATRQQVEELENVAIRVTAKFFDLYLAKLQLRNAEYNRVVNDTIYRVAQGRYSLGKIAENELLQVELGLMNARNAVTQNALNISVFEKELRNLLGLAPDTPLDVTAPSRPPLTNPVADLAIREARANRSDFKQFELTENQAQFDLQSAKISRRFSADLNASLGFNQTAPTLPAAYRNLQNAQAVSVGFTIPVFNAGRNAALMEAARHDLEATQTGLENSRNLLDIEVYNAVNSVNQLKVSLEISAKADTIGQKRYEVAKNRYLIGKIDITNLTIAQQEKDNALFNYIQTLRDYWLAHYRLRRLTLYDFENERKLGQAEAGR